MDSEDQNVSRICGRRDRQRSAGSVADVAKGQKYIRIVAVEEQGARMTVARQHYVSSAYRRLQEGDVPFAFPLRGAKSHSARRDWCLSKIGKRQRG